MMRIIISTLCIFLFVLSAYAENNFTLQSKAFLNNGKIPPLYTCDGKNISPQLSWSNPPPNTQSYALIVSSPNWGGDNVYFWVLYNIPNTMTSLAEGISEDVPDPIIVANNYFNETDYTGPCPPDGHSHRYVFTLYALDSALTFPPSGDVEDALQKIKNHTLQQAILVGTYNH